MSFPYLSDLIKALTGYELPLPIAMFGLLVGCAILVAAACMRAELRRLYESNRIGDAKRTAKGKDGQLTVLQMPPHELVTDLALAVMVAGVVGARVFHILEHLDSFMANPWDLIFSRSGLSIFGGLIFGTITGVVFIRRWNLPARPLLDAAAPAMMLGYAIGRIGCQISGDGDWGIASNMALKPTWLPIWAWAQTYDNNIFGAQIASPGVYPTPVYETLMALACFAVLWAVRRHPFRAGWLFSFYLLLAGIERLLIEQIRVNPVFNLGPVQATQAEMIAGALIVMGLAGLAASSRRAKLGTKAVPATSCPPC
jgi:phosphatidylglycerol:prolipoprotein diacylglycerol transferase